VPSCRQGGGKITDMAFELLGKVSASLPRISTVSKD
jgi:hypothetical protein